MKRLRDLRHSKKLTQKYMADFLKIDRTTYVKYETGSSEPNLETVQKLAAFFGVTVDDLLDNNRTQKADSPKDESAIEFDTRAGLLKKLDSLMQNLDYDKLLKLLGYAEGLVREERSNK